MPFYFGWGVKFFVIFDEFTPKQIEKILAHANRLFNRRPQDDELKRLFSVSVATIPFEEAGYGLLLRLTGDVWALEPAIFPPHALPGQRIRKARRLRERQERKVIKAVFRIAQMLLAAVQAAKAKTTESDDDANTNGSGGTLSDVATSATKASKNAAGPPKVDAKRNGAGKQKQSEAETKGDAAKRTISTVLAATRTISSMLYNMKAQLNQKLSRLSAKITSWLRGISADVPASASMRECLLRLNPPSYEQCREANIAAWAEERLPHGYQRERRLFLRDFLPIWLDTIGPIETMFVRGGQSIFGELFPERACVS